jgi:nucleotide-binding universal stress UspA family protein
MKRILVPTDFSDCADNALDFALQSARILPAEITLLHAFDKQGTLYTDYMGVNKEFRQVLLQEAEDKLTALKESIEMHRDIAADTRVIPGSLKKAIEQATSERNYDLIVMGTSGAGGLKERLWGSNTGEVIAASTLPVLAIPHEYKWKKPEKFLIATEHFEMAPSIVDKIFELAGLYMAHVEAAVFTAEGEEAAVYIEHARKAPYYEDQLKERYGEHDMKTTQLYGKNLEKALQGHIEKNEIDVLVMITYKKGFWDRLFHPSLSKRMSYHSKVPLLVVPGNL